jgi:hypothetical protein
MHVSAPHIMIPSTDTTDTGTGTPEKALMEDAAAPAGDSDAFNTPAEVDFPDGGLRVSTGREGQGQGPSSELTLRHGSSCSVRGSSSSAGSV